MTNGVSEVIISNLAKEMNNNNRRGGKKCLKAYISVLPSVPPPVRRVSVTGLSFLRNDKVIPC